MCTAVALHASIASAAVLDFESGLRWAGEAMAIARRAGRGPWTRRAELCVAIHLARLGRFEEARAAAGRSLDSAAAEHPAAATYARMQRTAILNAAGIRDEAASELLAVLWPQGGSADSF
jgi:hypothetical protein